MVKISKRPRKKPLTQVLAQELVETVEGDPGSHHLSLCLLGGFHSTPEPSPTKQASLEQAEDLSIRREEPTALMVIKKHSLTQSQDFLPQHGNREKEKEQR